jgi:hypothetical protein
MDNIGRSYLNKYMKINDEIVWQLMRKYTLSLLSKLSPDGTPIVETEILSWANQRLSDAGKPIKVKHFQVWIPAITS